MYESQFVKQFGTGPWRDRREDILSRTPQNPARVAVIGNQPEALLLSVLLSESKVGCYLAGPFTSVRTRNPASAWDEARWFLGLHRQNGTIQQVADIEDLPLQEIEDVILVGHGTSQAETGEIERTVRTVARGLAKNTNVIFAGLSKPGYTRIIGETIERQSGLSLGSEIAMYYLPLLWNGEPPQLLKERTIILAEVAGNGLPHVSELLLRVFPSMASTRSVRAAEAAGLFAPIYRHVVGALELELASFCEGVGVDYSETIGLCRGTGLQSLGPPRTIQARDALAAAIALSGVGGRSAGVIRAARRVNEHAPAQVLALVKKGLERCGRRLRHSRIAVLGLGGLQTDASVSQGTPAIFRTLKRKGAIVSFYPDHGPSEMPDRFDESVTIERTISGAVKRANCALIALDRLGDPDLTPQRLASEMSRPAAVCDLTGVLEASNVERAGLFYSCIGRGSSGA